MNNKIETILLSISDKATPRSYLILFKDYLQRNWPEIRVNYFISQHDNDNVNLRQASVLESGYAARGADLIIAFDGYMSKDMYEGCSCPKVLLHLPEEGIPRNMSDYLSGFDYLVLDRPGLRPFFQEKAARAKVTVLDSLRSIIGEELKSVSREARARERLYREYPHLRGKRIFSCAVQGICRKQLINKYTQFPLKEFLKQLPEDVVFMTDCDQIKVASEMISCRYSEKFIFFEDEKTEDVLLISDWIVSNLSVASYLEKPKLYLEYSDSRFERMIRKIDGDCMVLGDGLKGKMLGLLGGEIAGRKQDEMTVNSSGIDIAEYFLSV